MPAIHGELVVVVVPFLPRAASIEWHVIAVVDQQQQRQKLTQMRSLENCQIRCEAMQSYPTCATAVTISLALTSSSASTINLDVILHGMVEMFKQVVEKMSKYGDITPLSFRTFFRTNIVKREALKTGKSVTRIFKYPGKMSNNEVVLSLFCVVWLLRNFQIIPVVSQRTLNNKEFKPKC